MRGCISSTPVRTADGAALGCSTRSPSSTRYGALCHGSHSLAVRDRQRALSSLLLVELVCLWVLSCSRPESNFTSADAWTECAWPVAHALGGYQGTVYTNTKEAFLANYARGFRLFEVDLIETSDAVLVANHDWETPGRFDTGPLPLSYAAFKTARVYGRLTPLTSWEVLDLVASHRDVRLILDIKGRYAKSLSTVVEEARRIDPTLLDRVIPEFSRQEHLKTALSLYPFRSLIYTPHLSPYSDEDVVAFVRRHGVPVVSLHESRFSTPFVQALGQAGAAVYVYTVNSPERAAFYIQSGVKGVYTDSLLADSTCARSSHK